jgi:hypothetical protein
VQSAALPSAQRAGSARWALRMFVQVEDEILVGGLDAQVVEGAQQLGAVVGAVVDHMQQHLPQDQVFILPLREGLFE